jgi:tetratricopeptide (TPR) repeat protein
MSQERIVRLYLDAASAHRDRGDTLRARDLLREAQEMISDMEDPRLAAAVQASLGVAEREAGELDLAHEHLTEAVNIRRGLGDRHGIARALGDLASVALEAGNREEASERAEEALRVSEDLDPGRTRAEVMEHAGRIHLARGDAARAIPWLEQALSLYERMGDRGACLRVQEVLARTGPLDPSMKPHDTKLTLDEEIETVEEQRLREALRVERGNQSRAARHLGVTETRVRNLMRRHSIPSVNKRGRPRKDEGAS